MMNSKLGQPLSTSARLVPKATQGGSDDRSNLAVSCYRFNEFEGVKTDAIAPGTGQLVPLFNLRMQVYFAWVNGGTPVIGLTSTGRVTVIA